MSGQRNPRSLRDLDGSGAVTLDKADLTRDGLVDEDGTIPEDQPMWYDRLGEGVYLVRAVDDHGNVPEVEECELVRRLAAELVLDRLDGARAHSSAD